MVIKKSKRKTATRTVRLLKNILKKVSQKAKSEKITVNAYLTRIITDAVTV